MAVLAIVGKSKSKFEELNLRAQNCQAVAVSDLDLQNLKILLEATDEACLVVQDTASKSVPN